MNLIGITEDRLTELIDFAVKKAVSQIKENDKPEEKDRYMTIEELQEYLPGKKPAKQTIYGWVYNRKIPYKKVGKPLYFLKSEIDEWIENGRMINQ